MLLAVSFSQIAQSFYVILLCLKFLLQNRKGDGQNLTIATPAVNCRPAQKLGLLVAAQVDCRRDWMLICLKLLHKPAELRAQRHSKGIIDQ